MPNKNSPSEHCANLFSSKSLLISLRVKMERNLDLLNRTRINYSELLIDIGKQYLKIIPYADPEEFLDTYLPSYEDIFKILKAEQMRLEEKKRMKNLKIQRAKISSCFLEGSSFSSI